MVFNDSVTAAVESLAFSGASVGGFIGLVFGDYCFWFSDLLG